ncbi:MULTISPECIES: DUF1624 domain-containing protein [Methylosinus]|uniref:DUF1624 domain-containing protein n=1 Tax=Methylosinus trichosporium (strain ATCC 35070 / NCIMB 11131 / UNIQEM 75 / OB3b) TaxID=595536 RepID=A0A2D2D0U5_METT3|nr:MULTISPECIES: heparan-alpha-glucosaminide N-acetyltransferase domain-containing protein [Methylosinus]ATQ68574.1 DUF1624 domain-containing protein [Methylosinus trichosporium OB3b]
MTETETRAAVREPAAALAAGARLPSIDRLRGLVIVLMALDHVRDFFDGDALRFDPTDLDRTYPALFLTRFVTHFCAPIFTFLAGVSAFLHGLALDDPRALSRLLWTRGLWLILVDAFLISPVWTLGSGAIELGTLWAIGCGMIALAAFVFLPSGAALSTGAVILAGHNLLDGVHARDLGALAPLWTILHEKGPLPFGLSGQVYYPILPWIGVIFVGYGLGPVFLWSPERRARALTALGVSALALYALLRASNVYGDARLWTSYPDAMRTTLSFLDVSKYPPSLLYVLVTLGVGLLLLPTLEKLKGAAARVLMTFGRVPFFAYVLHLYVILIAAFVVETIKGVDLRGLESGSGAPPENFGVGLAGAYVAWIAIMTALYPACVWFAGVKRRRRDWWLGYL